MHTDVILINKSRTHAQSNYTDTKLKAWFSRLLRHPARKQTGPILHPRTHTKAGQWNTWLADNDIMLVKLIIRLLVYYFIGDELDYVDAGVYNYLQINTTTKSPWTARNSLSLQLHDIRHFSPPLE